jgi:hypothetical protein
MKTRVIDPGRAEKLPHAIPRPKSDSTTTPVYAFLRRWAAISAFKAVTFLGPVIAGNREFVPMRLEVVLQGGFLGWTAVWVRLEPATPVQLEGVAVEVHIGR